MDRGEISAARRWCILRTGGSRTQKLEAYLNEIGIGAWVPTEHAVRRAPRGGPLREIKAPMAPTYVFVREDHLPILRRLEKQDGLGCPAFSIFRYYGATVLVPHRALHPLRQRQQDSYRASLPAWGTSHAKKERGEAYEPGAIVKIGGGAFQGLECVVEGSNGLVTTLSLSLFGRQSEIKVATCDLRRDDVAHLASAA